MLTLLLAAAMTMLAVPGQALTGDEDDLGARSLYEDSWSTPVLGPEDITRAAPVHPMTPPLSDLYGLRPRHEVEGCHVTLNGTTVKGCVYGVPGAAVEVAMVGDSHIGRLFPALEEIALRERWALRVYTKSACAFVTEPHSYAECDTYNAALREELAADPPDIVLTLALRRNLTDPYTRTWTWLGSIGVDHVVALWDTPAPKGLVPAECVADALSTGADLTTCAVELPDQDSGNPSMRAAAELVDVATFVDLRDWVCPESLLSPKCPAVLGRAQVYALGSHLATSFAPTLTDPIHQRLHEAGVATYRPSVDRVGGSDRYATAALLSRDVAPGGRVFVASGQDYPDALAAAARAGDGGAVLLTRPAALPAATKQALARLGPSQVVVVGGRSAVSDAVLTELRSFSSDVSRVSGPNRYVTAAEIARLAPTTRGGTVYVATGETFPDALAAAARAGKTDSPVLLVRRDGIPDATAAALTDLRPAAVVVVGGTAAVSEEVRQDLRVLTGVRVDRVGGADRYQTAALLAAGVPTGGLVHVASGTDFADALAAAPAATAADGAVLLVPPTRVPEPTSTAVRSLAPHRVILAGGRAAVVEEVKRSLIRLVR